MTEHIAIPTEPLLSLEDLVELNGVPMIVTTMKPRGEHETALTLEPATEDQIARAGRVPVIQIRVTEHTSGASAKSAIEGAFDRTKERP